MRRRFVAPGGGGTSQIRPSPRAELKPFRKTDPGSGVLTMPVSAPGNGLTSIGSYVIRLVDHFGPLWHATQFAPAGEPDPKMSRPRAGFPPWLGGAIALRTLNAIQFSRSVCCVARSPLAGPKLCTF